MTATLAAGALLVLPVSTINATDASAHTYQVNVKCDVLKVDLTNYQVDSKDSSHKNTVVVKINGGVVASNGNFGTSWSGSWNFAQTQINTWSVVVDAWDGTQYDVNKSGSQEPCSKPDKPKDTQVPETKEACDLTSFGFDGKAGVVERIITTTWKWDNPSWSWKSSVDTGKWKLVKEYSNDEYFKNCAPDKPHKDPVVKYGEFGGDNPTCLVPTVVWTRTKTVTTFSYKWNVKTQKWDETATTETTTDTETKTVKLTEEDFWKLGCAGVKPDPKPLSDSANSCNLKDYGFPNLSGFVSRTGIQPYVKGDGKWVLGPEQWNDWTFVKDYTNQEFYEKCAGKPEPDRVVKTHGDWTGQPTCDNPSIYQTREWTIVTTKQDWNMELRVWYWGDPVTTHKTETAKEPISLSAEELRQCPANQVVVPALVIVDQKCVVGDQGVGQKTKGSITVPKSEFYSVEFGEGVDPAVVDPGTYPVKLKLVEGKSWRTPLPEGWSYANEAKTVIVQNVTVKAAEDCSVPKPEPKVEHFSVPSQDCTGHYVTTWDMVSRPYWDGEWKFAAPVKENLTGPTLVKVLTNDEWWALGCYPQQPPNLVDHKSDTKANCDGNYLRTWDLVTTYKWVWSEEAENGRGSWVAQTPVVQNDSGWQWDHKLSSDQKDSLGCTSGPLNGILPDVPWGPVGGLAAVAVTLVAGAAWSLRRRAV